MEQEEQDLDLDRAADVDAFRAFLDRDWVGLAAAAWEAYVSTGRGAGMFEVMHGQVVARGYMPQAGVSECPHPGLRRQLTQQVDAYDPKVQVVVAVSGQGGSWSVTLESERAERPSPPDAYRASGRGGNRN